jgi:hypothetical protein
VHQSHHIITIAASDLPRFLDRLEAEETDTAAWFAREYPEGEGEFEIQEDHAEHHGRVAIVAGVDERWGEWSLTVFLDQNEIPYTKEPSICAYELRTSPYVVGDVGGFWVETRNSVSWHTVGDVVPTW